MHYEHMNTIQQIIHQFMLKILALLLVSIALAAEKDYSTQVRQLKSLIESPQYKHAAWNKLAYVTDTYGPRMWGSKVLEEVIDYMKKQAAKEGFQNIRLEPVSNFTKWVRGKQTLTLFSPRPYPTKLDVIGLGGSVSGNIEAEVIVVENFAELERVKDKIPGKILCFNNKWIDYSESVAYRVDGASIASGYGAVAMLVRSVAPSSISSVHTGYMLYDEQYAKIPCAAITVEDAQMFWRMQKRGQKIWVHLEMENQFIPNSSSNNLVFEIVGTTFPDQIVLAGGHIDTWDTGSQTGANDDGGGFITVFEAFKLLLKNGLRPKRTLRFIAWSGEESGSPRDGAAQYIERHKSELQRHVAAFENDVGSTKLIGFEHEGPGQDIVKNILGKYLSILNASEYRNEVFAPDIEAMSEYGIPIFDNIVEDTQDYSFYYRYHHSAGDSMSIMDPNEMDSNVVGIASFLYILADLETTVRSI